MIPMLASPPSHRRRWPCPTWELLGYESWPALQLTRWLYQTCPEGLEAAV